VIHPFFLKMKKQKLNTPTKPFLVGSSDFDDIIEENSFFIDKSMFF